MMHVPRVMKWQYRSIRNSACHFRSWHETDMPTALRDVRSQGQGGKHLLALSPFRNLAQFDARLCAISHTARSQSVKI